MMCEEKYKSYTKKICELGLQMGNFSTPDVDTFLAIKLKIQKELIPIFENIVIDLLGLKKLPQLNLNNVVQGITYALNNSNKKINDKNFYTQNALSFIHTVENVLFVTDHKCDLPAYKDKNPKDYISEACIKEQINLLKDLLFYSCIYIQDLFKYKNISIQGGYFTAPRNPLYMMFSELYHILYGNHTPFSPGKTRIFPAIATLRIMIEVKIRHALGIVGLRNKVNNAIDPIPLNKIFLTLDNYVKNGKVIFNIPYENVKKIYSWTNIYIHTGYKGYIWYPFIFTEYLQPFFYGSDVLLPHNTWNMKAGIRIKKTALEQIKNDIERPFELVCFNDENALEAVIID